MNMQLNNLMKHAQALQKKMELAQKEIENEHTEGEAGGGIVKITINGRHEIINVKIDPAILEEAEAIKIIEELIAGAYNAAAKKMAAVSREKISSIASGLNLSENLAGLSGGETSGSNE